MVVEERLTRHRVFDRPGRPVLQLAPDRVAAVRAFNERIRRSEIPFEAVDCLCGSSRFAEIARTDRYGLLQTTVVCTRCGLVQSNPRMTPDAYRWFYESDEYRRIYEGDRFVEIVEQNYEDGRAADVFSLVTAHRPAAQLRSLLEFGAGGGWNLMPFLEAGVEVTGYDYSPELVALGRSKGINLVQGGLEAVAGVYDVIVLNHVVEHFTDVPGALAVLGSHLAPGGFMAVEVPDIESFSIGQLQNAHTYYFSRRTLGFCGALAGLGVVDQRRQENGHMSAILVPGDAAEPNPRSLEGHYAEIAALVRRYDRTYTVRTAVRPLGRLLDAVGLKEPVRRMLLSD